MDSITFLQLYGQQDELFVMLQMLLQSIGFILHCLIDCSLNNHKAIFFISCFSKLSKNKLGGKVEKN